MTDYQGVDVNTLHSCSIPGCETPATRTKRTLCEKHYYRLRRNGTVKLTHPQREARGTCILQGCNEKDCGPHGYCQKHNTRIRRHGSPDIKLPTFCEWGPDHPSWQGNNIGRVAAHDRVRSRRGPARTHPCIDCGLPAAHWSYDHADPKELIDERGNPMSADPNHYQARCVPCHKRFDLDYLASTQPRKR